MKTLITHSPIHNFLLSLIAFTLSGCFSIKPTGGTDIGNPGGRQSEAFAASLNIESCRVLDFCISGFPEDICQDNAIHSRGVGEFLGGPNTASLADLENAVNQRDYNLNSNALSQCKAALNDLRCSDLPLNEIWDSNDRYNFSRIKKFWERLEPSCGGLVTPN